MADIFLEDVRCRADMGQVAVGLRNYAVYHDALCAAETNPATANDARDAVIENLILGGVMTTAEVAAWAGFSRQRVHQILQRMAPRG